MEPWFSIDGPWKSPMAFYYSSRGTPWFVCICMWPQCLSGRCGAGKGLLSLLIRLIRWKKSIRESTKEFSFRISFQAELSRLLRCRTLSCRLRESCPLSCLSPNPKRHSKADERRLRGSRAHVGDGECKCRKEIIELQQGLLTGFRIL